MASSTDATPAPLARRVWMAGARVLAWGTVAVVAAVFAMRQFGWESGVTAYLVALTPLFTAVVAAGAVVAGLARAWVATAAATVLLGVGVAWLAPLATAAPADGDVRMTVASVNMRFGEADADAIVALVAAEGVDILSVQELTLDAQERLRAAGLEDYLPYSATAPGLAAEGTGLWTRYPLSDAAAVPGLSFATIRGVVDTAFGEVTVFAVHPPPPLPAHHERWREQLDAVAAVADATRGPVIVAGDFNATLDHWPMREIQALGFVDAADEAGAGLHFTFPQERFGLALVAIDHVMTRDVPFVAREFTTVGIPGADHRAVVVGYAARGE